MDWSGLKIIAKEAKRIDYYLKLGNYILLADYLYRNITFTIDSFCYYLWKAYMPKIGIK